MSAWLLLLDGKTIFGSAETRISLWPLGWLTCSTAIVVEFAGNVTMLDKKIEAPYPYVMEFNSLTK